MATDELKPHEETYSMVMSLLKWGTIVSALVGLLVILLIAS